MQDATPGIAFCGISFFGWR